MNVSAPRASLRHTSGFFRRLPSVAGAGLGFVMSLGLMVSGSEIVIEKDLEFARVNDIPLKLDLYRPSSQRGPLILYVHGGAWKSGSKNEMPLKQLVADGYPAVSVEYRLSTAARFPAQIHDIKAAIRYLRASSRDLQIDASRIVVAGSSAGGHLAALVGVTNGKQELEGTVGTHLSESSSVQGIISFFGAANLTTILQQSTPHGLNVRVPALDLLLGGQPSKEVELAQLASPVFHVDKSDPPLLLLHGDQDAQMPINQSHELDGAYRAIDLPSTFHVIHGAGHGGKEFYDAERLEIVRKFLRQFGSK